MKLHYPSDERAIAQLGPGQRISFAKLFADLEAEHVRIGAPYGNALAKATGVEAWIPFFQDEKSPADSLVEDLSYAE